VLLIHAIVIISATATAGDSAAVIRVNQVGYLPAAPKIAVVCAVERVSLSRFTVETANGRVVVGPANVTPSGPFGPCVETWRLDFSRLKTRGLYRVRAGAYVSPMIRIAPDVYAGLADTLMGYMRQQPATIPFSATRRIPVTASSSIIRRALVSTSM
jgi:hypothetical protein